MQLSRILFSLFLLAASAQMPVCHAAPLPLPNSVEGLDQDVRTMETLFGQLMQMRGNEEKPTAWLSARVNALPPLFRYELARRLNVMGMREDALFELARARLGRDMDAAECINKDRSTPADYWIMLTDLLENSLLNSPRIDLDLWLMSANRALASEPYRKRTSALWLCGKNNIKDTESGNAARQATYEFLKADYEKISAEARENPPESTAPERSREDARVPPAP